MKKNIKNTLQLQKKSFEFQSTMICKGCDEDKSLIKAHIIPESFYRDLRGDESALLLVPTANNKHPKKSPIGVYDKEILCGDCEKRFQKVDAYAANLLINNKTLEELWDSREVLVGYKIHNVDYDLLKRFVISVLWRASISNMEFFKNVKLGPLEDVAKKLIWDESSGSIHEFSFFLGKFNDAGTLVKAILDPHPEKWFGRNYYRFYLGGFVLYVKADYQQTPEEWAQFIPSDDSLIIINRGDIKQSKEFNIFLKAKYGKSRPDNKV